VTRRGRYLFDCTCRTAHCDLLLALYYNHEGARRAVEASPMGKAMAKWFGLGAPPHALGKREYLVWKKIVMSGMFAFVHEEYGWR
jgi:hypothetical protein